MPLHDFGSQGDLLALATQPPSGRHKNTASANGINRMDQHLKDDPGRGIDEDDPGRGMDEVGSPSTVSRIGPDGEPILQPGENGGYRQACMRICKSAELKFIDPVPHVANIHCSTPRSP